METTFVDLENTQPCDPALSELSADELAQVGGGGAITTAIALGFFGGIGAGAGAWLAARFFGQRCYP